MVPDACNSAYIPSSASLLTSRDSVERGRRVNILSSSSCLVLSPLLILLFCRLEVIFTHRYIKLQLVGPIFFSSFKQVLGCHNRKSSRDLLPFSLHVTNKDLVFEAWLPLWRCPVFKKP